MTEPSENQPKGWRQPSDSESRFGVRLVVVGAIFLVALIAFVVILTLATYG